MEPYLAVSSSLHSEHPWLTNTVSELFMLSKTVTEMTYLFVDQKHQQVKLSVDTVNDQADPITSF